MNGSMIGIDPAKNVFEIYVEDETGQVMERRQLSRKKMLAWFANCPRAVVGMEACGGAHDWARELKKLGHEVRLRAPQYVKPWVPTNKSDPVDARAICRAMQEPGMRFVAIAGEAQQAVQAFHRVRSRLMGNRTALVHQIRGILLEYGVAIPKSVGSVRKALPLLLAEERWTLLMRYFLVEQHAELQNWDARIEEVTGHIKRERATQPVCQRLEQVRGIGPLSASALWLKAGGHPYQNGRHFAAALGAGIQAYRDGGQDSIRGDQYTRGSVSPVVTDSWGPGRRLTPGEQQDHLSCWLRRLVARRGMNKAMVALANKNARVALALMQNDQPYDVRKMCRAAAGEDSCGRGTAPSDSPRDVAHRHEDEPDAVTVH